MEWESFSTDFLEQRLIAAEHQVARVRTEQMEILEVLDSRQVATADGARSLSEWVSARLDIGLDNARTLVRTTRRMVDHPDLLTALGTKEVTFDRVEALSRIPHSVGLLDHLDVAGVRSEAAKRARVDSEHESRSADDRFLVMQPSLDESWWRLWGGLDGPAGAIVDKVLTESADLVPSYPDGTGGTGSWRKATALLDLALGQDPPPAQVSVFVDAGHATATNAETGVRLDTGPRVGRQALEAVLCDAVTEVTVLASDGRYMEYGRKARTVTPALKRALLDKHNTRVPPTVVIPDIDSRLTTSSHGNRVETVTRRI